LVDLGLDSLSLAQIKGLLEEEFQCDVADDFVFRDDTALLTLALAIKEGKEPTPEQLEALDIQGGAGAGVGKAGGKDKDFVVEHCACFLICPCFAARRRKL